MSSSKKPRTVAEVVEILRRGSQFSFVIDDGEAMREAALIIENLQAQVAELLPYMQSYIYEGLLVGPGPDGHMDDCDDCKWYQTSLALAKRWGAGEPNAGQFKNG